MKIDFPPSTSYFRFMRSFKNISTNHILEISFVRTRHIFTLLYLQHLHCITFVIYERRFSTIFAIVSILRALPKYTLNMMKYCAKCYLSTYHVKISSISKYIYIHHTSYIFMETHNFRYKSPNTHECFTSIIRKKNIFQRIFTSRLKGEGPWDTIVFVILISSHLK